MGYYNGKKILGVVAGGGGAANILDGEGTNTIKQADDANSNEAKGSHAASFGKGNAANGNRAFSTGRVVKIYSANSIGSGLNNTIEGKADGETETDANNEYIGGQGCVAHSQEGITHGLFLTNRSPRTWMGGNGNEDNEGSCNLMHGLKNKTVEYEGIDHNDGSIKVLTPIYSLIQGANIKFAGTGVIVVGEGTPDGATDIPWYNRPMYVYGSNSQGFGRGIQIEASFAMGQGFLTTVKGAASAVFNYHNKSLYPHQLIGGQFNDNKENTLFEIGNGTSDSARSNAFEVISENGEAAICVGKTKITETQLKALLALLG